MQFQLTRQVWGIIAVVVIGIGLITMITVVTVVSTSSCTCSQSDKWTDLLDCIWKDKYDWWNSKYAKEGDGWVTSEHDAWVTEEVNRLEKVFSDLYSPLICFKPQTSQRISHCDSVCTKNSSDIGLLTPVAKLTYDTILVNCASPKTVLGTYGDLSKNVAQLKKF